LRFGAASPHEAQAKAGAAPSLRSSDGGLVELLAIRRRMYRSGQLNKARRPILFGHYPKDAHLRVPAARLK